MNTRPILAAIAFTFAAAGPAFAQEATIDRSPAFQSQTTRAAVQAEAMRAVASGALHESAQLALQYTVDSALSRDAVRAATIQALKRGSVASLNAEAYTFG